MDPSGQPSDARRIAELGATAGATAPERYEGVGARARLQQAETAMQTNDDARARYLLQQAEADVWLEGARDRNRLLLQIHTRQSELAEKKAREDASATARLTAAQAPAAPVESRPAPAAWSVAPVEIKAAPAPVVSTPASTIITLGDVVFDTGSAVLRSAAAPELDRLAALLRENPKRLVAIHGFTDSVGNYQYNVSLSMQRAQAVRQALLSRGITIGRMTVKGFGAAHPVASNATATGRQQNRRVEIHVSDTLGRLPPGRAPAAAR
jgi:outer membrane protein OmpA-like peptidoglycan-associated protein